MEQMICGRCGAETNMVAESWFTDEPICLVCDRVERQHPVVRATIAAENAAVERGDYDPPRPTCGSR